MIKMTKKFKNLEEIKKYYNKETNTYIFKKDNEYIELVIFDFDLNINANIDAYNIEAYHIEALNIDVLNIDAFDIKAKNIEALNIKAWNIEAENIKASGIKAKMIEVKNIEAESIFYCRALFIYESIKCKCVKVCC